MYYTKDMTVSYYESDINNRLKLSGALRYMQQTSSEQLAALGQSPEELYAQGMVFLLTKSNLKIHRMPWCSEKITVGTAAVAVKGPRFFREFIMDTQEGERLISGWSLWVLTDIREHKILRPSAYPHQFPWQEPQLEQSVGDIPIPKDSELPRGAPTGGYTQAVRYSHLDVNAHVNNCIYGDFVCDALPQDVLLTSQLDRVAIHFQKEAKMGSNLEISTVKVNDFTYKIGGKQGENPCFEALVELKR